MLYRTTKSLKIGFWILLPMFLISTTKVDSKAWVSDIVEGGYGFQISGSLNSELSGTAHFETKVDPSGQEMFLFNPFLEFYRE